MAISGGSYRVEDDKANALSNDMKNRNETINSTIGSYNSSNYEKNTFLGIDWLSADTDNSQNSNDFVGITPEMLSKITTAIDTYSSNLTGILDEMPDAVYYTMAFRGTSIEAAVKNFVSTVKEVCKSYLQNLKEAENQIIESVNKQYAASDEDISGQLNSDSSAISGS